MGSHSDHRSTIANHRSLTGHELPVAVSVMLPNSRRWTFALLVLAAARGSLISASAVSGYASFG